MKMVNFLFSVSSFSGILLFLFIGNKINIPFLPFIPREFLNQWYDLARGASLVVLVLLFAWLTLFIADKSLKNSDTLVVKSIQPMESNFLPVYIGLFVIALELDSELATENVILLILLFVFWIFLENVSYFNPFFLLFGYRFYEVTTSNDKKFTVICKMKDVKQITTLDRLIRINNFSYLQK